MTDVVIVSAVRTPIGRFQGALSSVRPDDLAAVVMREAVARAKIDPQALDEVVFGCANQAGEDNRNVARMALLLAGLPQGLPGVTVNRLCASGLEAIVQGARQIRTGDSRLVLVGGVESMSRAPYAMPRGPQHTKTGNLTAWDTSLGWRFPNPALEALFPLEPMGETAENVAEREGVSREDQDRFALRSHERASAARSGGLFAAEIVPVETAAGLVADDEGPRADSSLAALARLKPAFRKGGSVTAGNASTLNDGAAALVLAEASYARAQGLTILGRFVASGVTGLDPRVMGLGPVEASQKALSRAGWTAESVDLWEINEAFAAQALAVTRRLGLDPERVNAQGGAIALGHPLGSSGARLVVTLLHAMARRGARRGAASLCVGVGQGLTGLFEI